MSFKGAEAQRCSDIVYSHTDFESELIFMPGNVARACCLLLPALPQNTGQGSVMRHTQVTRTVGFLKKICCSVGPGGLGQWIKWLWSKLEGLSSDSQHPHKTEAQHCRLRDSSTPEAQWSPPSLINDLQV